MVTTALSRWVRVGAVTTAMTAVMASVGIVGGAAPTASAAACTATAGVSPGAAVFGYGDAELAQTFSETRALGAGWVRIDIPWSSVEADRGVFTWDQTDRVVGAARAQGLRVLGLITYTPRWARLASPIDSDKVAPADPAAFGAFAAQVAQHYGSAMAAYEIWNEPNLAQFFLPRVDPTRYTRLLQAASAAIRRVNPGAVIVSGGVAGADTAGGNVDPADFVRGIYAAGAAGAMTAVGMHPYTYPLDPSDPRPNRYNHFDDVATVHSIMAANGAGGSSIWITEFGAPTGSAAGALSPSAQASNLVSGIQRARRLGYVGNFFVYSMRDSGPNPYDREQNFGLRSANDAPKPSYTAVQRLFTGC